jgi:hypothetical protein
LEFLGFLKFGVLGFGNLVPKVALQKFEHLAELEAPDPLIPGVRWYI